MLQLMDLRQRWLELGIDRLKASEDVVLKWWGQIEEQYSKDATIPCTI